MDQITVLKTKPIGSNDKVNKRVQKFIKKEKKRQQKFENEGVSHTCARVPDDKLHQLELLSQSLQN